MQTNADNLAQCDHAMKRPGCMSSGLVVCSVALPPPNPSSVTGSNTGTRIGSDHTKSELMVT